MIERDTDRSLITFIFENILACYLMSTSWPIFVLFLTRDGRLFRDFSGSRSRSRKSPGDRGTIPRDASPDLSRRFLCPVRPGPGQKSAGRAGQEQIFTGLSRMVVPRDKRNRDKNRGSVPSLAHPWFSPPRTHGVESKNYTSFNNVEVEIFIVSWFAQQIPSAGLWMQIFKWFLINYQPYLLLT